MIRNNRKDDKNVLFHPYQRGLKKPFTTTLEESSPFSLGVPHGLTLEKNKIKGLNFTNVSPSISKPSGGFRAPPEFSTAPPSLNPTAPPRVSPTALHRVSPVTNCKDKLVILSNKDMYGELHIPREYKRVLVPKHGNKSSTVFIDLRFINLNHSKMDSDRLASEIFFRFFKYGNIDSIDIKDWRDDNQIAFVKFSEPKSAETATMENFGTVLVDREYELIDKEKILIVYDFRLFNNNNNEQPNYKVIWVENYKDAKHLFVNERHVKQHKLPKRNVTVLVYRFDFTAKTAIEILRRNKFVCGFLSQSSHIQD